VADIALDADALRRDRQRYAGLLEQAELQIAAWNERADHLQQAIDGLDRLLALAGDDAARDGGFPRGRSTARRAPVQGAVAAAPAPLASDAPASKPARPGRATKAAPAKKAGRPAVAGKPPSPVATPAAPEPVEPPTTADGEAPKGTDALRVVFESDPQRAWSLAELIDALGERGWLPTSRRPEEGARISLKRLAERGGVARTDDGRWRLAEPGAPSPEAGSDEENWPEAEPPLAPDAPAADAAPAAEEPGASVPPPANPVPEPRPASYGRPVGGTVTEL
jgi:hypothetical protein